MSPRAFAAHASSISSRHSAGSERIAHIVWNFRDFMTSRTSGCGGGAADVFAATVVDGLVFGIDAPR